MTNVLVRPKAGSYTGARPATLRELGVPGAELEGIHYVREVAEAQALYDAIADCKARSARAVVIGAGYIGMEVAAALAGNGLAVTMVFPGGMLMERLLPPEAASFYEEYYKERGVEVMWGQRGAGFEGEEGRLEAVLLQDGRRIEAGMAVVGIGARVNKELFEGQLDMAKGGIEVDGRLRTSNPDVYAIGDVAAFPLVGYGGQLQRQEHVTNARLSAAHAVSAIMAPEETGDYEYLPFFYSRFFALSWQFYGTNKGKSVMFGDKGAAKFGMYWLAEGRVVGAFLEGGSAEEFGWIKAVALRRPEAPATEERLAAKGLAFAAAVAAQEA
ncbi:unnamed protein product [Ostreobium quekettii]|uniref:monodehydroascorbate reductase (NADH) n=1 Tax=Ostreobium quekettii TaxID=121088 RepID=A0A8S1ITT6_9CHLO|nr:unnamed protein product [Ostreobium quekettii]